MRGNRLRFLLDTEAFRARLAQDMFEDVIAHQRHEPRGILHCAMFDSAREHFRLGRAGLLAEERLADEYATSRAGM